MRGELRIMGPGGDERVEWDTDVLETVEDARTRFARLLLSGHVGFVTAEAPARRIEEFEPEAGRIVVVMPMAGG